MGDCLTYHYDAERTGAGEGAASATGWRRYNTGNLGAPLRGAPLFLQAWRFRRGAHAAQRHKVVFVAACDNNVYAFAGDALRAASTNQVWQTTVGPPLATVPPPPGGGTAQSNIPTPIGVCSTPVIDPMNARIFVVALQDDGSGWGTYHVYALDIDTGTVIQSAVLSDAGESGRPTFDGGYVDRRGALTVVNGPIAATFADLWGWDEGPYHGWVVSINANNLDDQLYFSSTANVFGGGIWGPGGVATAPDGSMFVATGNGTTANAAYYASLPPGKEAGDIGDYFIGVVKLAITWDGYNPSHTLID